MEYLYCDDIVFQSMNAEYLSIYLCGCMLRCFSHSQLFLTPCTVAHHAPQFMGFSRQEYWSELPCSPPKVLPYQGIEPSSSESPALQAVLYHWTTRETFHLVKFSSISFNSILSFSVYKSSTSLVKWIPKYIVLFILTGIFLLIRSIHC